MTGCEMGTDGTPAQTTEILQALSAGDEHAAEQLAPMVYDELRQLAAAYLKREPPGHTLQPTALVNEAFMKLVDQTRVDWQGRAHFIAVGAQMMRRILVDHARGKQRQKRGGGWRRVFLQEPLTLSPERDEDVVALDDALQKLEKLHPRQARMIELRFFGGLTVEECARVLDVSERTIRNDWRTAKAWLRRELSQDDQP